MKSTLAWHLQRPSPRFASHWLAGNEGMETKMKTTMMGYIGTTIM